MIRGSRAEHDEKGEGEESCKIDFIWFVQTEWMVYDLCIS